LSVSKSSKLIFASTSHLVPQLATLQFHQLFGLIVAEFFKISALASSEEANSALISGNTAGTGVLV